MKGPKIVHRSIVCWSSAVVATEVNDEVILMNLERDRCYGLSGTGSNIWRRLCSPIQVSELTTQLEYQYDSMPGEIEPDVLRTLRELAGEGLIRVVATAA
jgi:coenzyme PQQ synthesis protein D (PqqD)